MIPSVDGEYLKGAKDSSLLSLCRCLQLVSGMGGVNLILFERDSWLSKIRTAFDALPKDFTGRASRGNVLDLLNDTKDGIVKFLAGIHDPMNEHIMGFLDKAIR